MSCEMCGNTPLIQHSPYHIVARAISYKQRCAYPHTHTLIPHTIKRTHGSEWSIHMHRILRTHSPLSCDLQKQIDFKKVFVFFFCSVVGFERFEFIAAFGFVEIWIWSKFFDVHTQHSRYEISERCVYCFACKYTLAWASVCLSFWLCI